MVMIQNEQACMVSGTTTSAAPRVVPIRTPCSPSNSPSSATPASGGPASAHRQRQLEPQLLDDAVMVAGERQADAVMRAVLHGEDVPDDGGDHEPAGDRRGDRGALGAQCGQAPMAEDQQPAQEGVEQ